MAGCGGVGIAEAGVPAINQIIPQTIAAGSGNTTVQIVGAHVNNATVVLWNGTPLTTTLVNDTTVASPVESASLATPGVAELQLMNSVTGTKSGTVALSIAASNNAPALSITVTSLPSGTVGSPYSATLTATGGTLPYIWQSTSGRMPAGLTLDSAAGTISGTPTAAGTYSIGLTVKDKSKPSQAKFIALTLIISRNVTVTPLSITTTSLPAASYGVSYSQTLAATGGTPAYSWSIASGSLPPGLTLGSSTGAISGTPTQGGTFSFTVAAKDSGSPQQSKTVGLGITVSQTPLKVNTTSLSSGTVGSGYSQTLSVSGGTAPYTWTLASGSLPAGLTLSSAGVISGTPSASGTFTFSASVSDKSNPVQTLAATYSITVSAVALRIGTTALSAGTVGNGYSQALSVSGGTAPYAWTLASGSLPAGLTLSSAGVISGTPSANGTATFTARVNDSGNPAQSQSAALSISIAPSALHVAATSFPQGIFGRPYNATLQASGGTPGYSWSVASGSLPAGLALNTANGTISGTPTAGGTASFTTSVSDSGSPVQTASALVNINISSAPLTITASTLPSVNVGAAYAQTLQATGGTAPYLWSIAAGQLPAGITLSSTGVLSGTPSASGTAAFTTVVTDSSNPTQKASLVMSLLVNPAQSTLASPHPLSLLVPASSTGTVGSAYSLTLGVSGGTTPYTFSTSGSLPAGLTLSQTGAITGTPASGSNGSYPITVSVTDSSSPAQTQSATTSIAISAAAASPLTIVPTTLASGTTGTAYSQTLQATGGTTSYTWSVSSGSLPAGLTLSAGGAISGTPSTAGASTFTAMVTDSSSPSQTQSTTQSITIAAAQASGPATWYVRTDGGTRYSTTVTNGQCDGQGDAPYPGSGVNQHCAFKDVRYLWSDGSYTYGTSMPGWGWVISGGDTVIIEGSIANGVSYRVGWDSPTTYCTSTGCWGITGSPTASGAPAPPSGTASAHTKIYGGCVVLGNCNTGNSTNYGNLTQLHGGYSAGQVLSLAGAQYVDVVGLDITDWSQCTRVGSPAYPTECITAGTLDDFVDQGLVTTNTTSNILLEDVNIHGVTKDGIMGPIGGLITMTRVRVAFNGAAGWEFDDGAATSNAPGSTINATDVLMEWNGCNEEYPIVHSVPAISCYDPNSAGFGDAWSAQGTGAGGTTSTLTMTCLRCIIRYNTKDGFGMNHDLFHGLTITNSASYGNSGQQWKWSTDTGYTTLMQNSVSVGNCMRLSQPFPGAPSNYNQYLSNFCRANGDNVSIGVNGGSTTTLQNNTITGYANVTYDITAPTSGADTINFVNNVNLGFQCSGCNQPATYYFGIGTPIVNRSNNLYYNQKVGTNGCPSTGFAGELCTDPLLVNEPALQIPSESALDNFDFYPASGSPVIGAGIYIPSLTTDYTGSTRPNPPSLGAYEFP